MTDDTKSKVRIRFQNGAEFEAEGSQSFIEQQRNYFLSLIGKDKLSARTADSAPRPNTAALYQAQNTAPSAFEPLSNEPVSPQENMPSALPPADQTASVHYLWERLLREDGKYVYLRRKYKVDPVENVCLLLAGARALLKRGEMSALDLSRCLKESKITLPGRLDRVVGGYIKQGYLVCEGAKRSRTYKLTDSGFAHAFVVAEKLVKECL